MYSNHGTCVKPGDTQYAALKITSARSFRNLGDYSFLKIRCALPDSPIVSCCFITVNSVIGRNIDVLKRLVLEAKREYETEMEHRVHIFTADG